mgnify:CR=1 FL=1
MPQLLLLNNARPQVSYSLGGGSPLPATQDNASVSQIVAAAGNEAQDLGHPTTDEISPDWPPDTAVTREVRNNCRVAPAELPGVVTVSSVGVTSVACFFVAVS